MAQGPERRLGGWHRLWIVVCLTYFALISALAVMDSQVYVPVDDADVMGRLSTQSRWALTENDPVSTLLSTYDISNERRATLWDLYSRAEDADQLAGLLVDVEVQPEVKADLWDLKAGNYDALARALGGTRVHTDGRGVSDLESEQVRVPMADLERQPAVGEDVTALVARMVEAGESEADIAAVIQRLSAPLGDMVRVGLPDGRVLRLRANLAEAEMLSVVKDYQTALGKVEASRRREHYYFMFLVWAIPCLGLYAVGHAFKWVRDGFRHHSLPG